MAATTPWERRKGEGAKAWDAFCLYRDMGPSRSHVKVGQATGKDPVQISRWSKRHDWVKRVEAWQAHGDAIAQAERETAIKDAVRRHVDTAANLLKLVNQCITEARPALIAGDAPGSIAGMLKAAVAIERQGLGLADRVEVSGRDGGPITLDLATQAEERIAAMVGDITGEGTGGGGGDGPGDE